jgi:hypothetical protein
MPAWRAIVSAWMARLRRALHVLRKVPIVPGNSFVVATISTAHFTGALAQNAAEGIDLDLPMSIAAGLHSRSLVRQVIVKSVQNLDWEIYLFDRGTKHTELDPDRNGFLGHWRLTASQGLRIGATGLFYYYVDGLAVPYEDRDQQGRLHLVLINRSATAKDAGAPGALTIQFRLEPTYG